MRQRRENKEKKIQDTERFLCFNLSEDRLSFGGHSGSSLHLRGFWNPCIRAEDANFRDDALDVNLYPTHSKNDCK